MKNFDIIEKKDLESQGIKFLSVKGYLDAHTVNQLEEKLYTMINSGIKKILIDFNDLVYISSAGIGLLIGATQKIRMNGGDLVIFNPTQKVYNILDTLGFTKIFNIAYTEQEALGFLSKKWIIKVETQSIASLQI